MDREKYADAVRISLSILVGNPNDKQTRAHLSDIMRRVPKSLEVLNGELSGAADAAPALAFLAVVIKEYGVLDESVTLYRRSCELLPDNASYMLNYAHTLEVMNEHRKAVDVIVGFLQYNRACAVSNVSCQAVLDVLGGLDDPPPKLGAPDTYQRWAGHYHDVKWSDRDLELTRGEGAASDPPRFDSQPKVLLHPGQCCCLGQGWGTRSGGYPSHNPRTPYNFQCTMAP